MVTAMVKLANSPTRGSTPAMIEKLIASGMRARATTRPASTSTRSRRGSVTAATHSGVVRGSRADVMAPFSGQGVRAVPGAASATVRGPIGGDATLT